MDDVTATSSTGAFEADPLEPRDPGAASEHAEIEKLPPKTWVTLGLFAVFVVAFGTCAANFLFR